MGTKPSWIEGLVQAILHTSQVNVIAVDWVYGSTGAYPSAVQNVTRLALAISQFISKLLVSYCAFPVQGAWPGNCSQPVVFRCWTSGFFYSRFFFFPSFSPGLSMPSFFFFLLSFDIFWKKNPSCQLPLQLRTNLKPALGFLRSIFTGQSSPAQKFCPGSWRE